jgi:multiple sugar transport system substrate-binding protein
LKLKRNNLIFIAVFFLVVLLAFFLELKPRISPAEKELVFWQYWSGREKEPLEALVLLFNAVHAKDYGFKVKMLDISMPQKKIMMAMAGNVAPDLVHLDGGMVVDFGLRGTLEELDINPSLSSNFIPIYIEALKLGGKLYALPLMPTCEAMHINKTLLEQLGLAEPKTLDDLVRLTDASMRISRDERNAVAEDLRSGFGNRFENHSDTRLASPEKPELTDASMRISRDERNAVAEDLRSDFKVWMPSWPPWSGKFLPVVFGGNWGQQQDDGSWLITANSEENIAAWTWVQDNFASKLKPGELASFTEGFSSYQSPDNPFFAGKVLIENSGVWERQLAGIYNPKMQVSIAPFPSKAPNATFVSVDALAIPKNARNKKEALKFMLWLLEQANVESLAIAQGKFSPLNEVSEGFYAEHPNPYIKVFEELAKSPNARFFPQLKFIKRYERAIKEYYDKVLRMEMKAKDALNELQKKFEIE